MFPKLCFSFAKLRKFRPNFDLVFREISRNSRVISRNTKLKISRNYENENFRRQPTWDAISVTKKGFVIQFLFLCKNVCRTEVVLYLYSYATSSGTFKLRVKDSLWWAQKPCDGLDSLWGTCSLLFVRPHWELGQSRRFKDVTQCNMELMWGWGEGGWGRDMRCGGEDGG